MNPPSITRRPTGPVASVRRHARPLVVVAVALVAALALIPAAPARVAGGPAGPSEVDAWLDAQLRDAGIVGAALVVVRDGRIVHERGFGVADDTGRPVGPETPFMLGSVSKSITATAILQLVDRGLVDLDAPVTRYLPDFRLAGDGGGSSITIRQLLTHLSGIPGRAGTIPLGRPATTLAGQVAALRDVVPESAPGTRYDYSNANYLVLGRLVEVVSGEAFGGYLDRHVFGPLEMTHATIDPATAAANGLSRAHRLWFGLADSHTALDRVDLAPAGFVSASVDDIGHFLIAQLDGGRFEGRAVVSSEAVSTMQTGTVPTGLDGERAGMGWMASTLDGERIVAHTGSTTDMAAVQVLVPDRHLGVALLMNTQSTLYELLHKPDAIGLGVVSLLLGQAPGGTLQAFYPVLDLTLLALLALWVRGLVRLVRAPLVTVGALGAVRSTPSSPGPVRFVATRARWLGGRALRVYLDVLVPVVILVRAPDLFGAGWPVLVRIDVGLVLAGLVAIRLLDGAIRIVRHVQAGGMTGLRLGRPGIAGDGSIPLAIDR